jgi:hypothetical protein
LPCLIMIIDWALNGICAEPQHLIVNIVFIATYLVLNLCVVKAINQTIYPRLDWETSSTLWVLIILVPVVTSLWFGLCWATNAKL